MGWSWLAVNVVQTDSGDILDFVAICKRQWLHEVRGGVRRRLWRRAAAQRGDMIGIEDGIDREASLALL
eukprot:10574724-Karenia_brevis.AAC.1